VGSRGGTPTPLDLGRVLSESVALPGLLRERLWRAIGVPFFLTIGGTVLLAASDLHGHPRARLALGALIFCCVAAMAVVIHRLVLLPAGEANANASGRGLRRFALAVIAMLGLWAGFVVFSLAVSLVSLGLFQAANFWLLPLWIQTPGAAAGAWFVARLSLVTPGLVVDQPRALSTAWRISRGNGWRLAALLAIAPWLLVLYVQLMWPQGVDRVIFVLVIALSTLLAIFILFAISVSYRELIARAPPPTPPPA
jgi:hypothetical protein